MKWAVISAFHAQHPIWKAFNAEQIVKIEEAFGKGCVAEMIALTGEFSRKQYLKMKVIKRRAEILAEEQSLVEQSEFHHGFASGLTFLQTLAEKMKNPEGKRATDEQKRQLVYLFGAVHGDEIEKMKADLSWPEVAERVAEMVAHKVEIEEDTVKKILQRTGLSGVGKPGRAPTN